MKKIIILLILFLLSSNSAFSSTISKSVFICPVCDVEFTATLQNSGSAFGKNLDLKPVGAIIIPWPIPQCPDCHFAFYDDGFTEDEIILLKDYITSPDFTDLDHKDIQYYCLAKEYIFLAYDDETIADTLLQAVWESNNEKIINEAISYYIKLKPESDYYFTGLILLVEFNRRIKDFDKALEYCKIVKVQPEYKDYIFKIITLQEELIEKKDSKEHALP